MLSTETMNLVAHWNCGSRRKASRTWRLWKSIFDELFASCPAHYMQLNSVYPTQVNLFFSTQTQSELPAPWSSQKWPEQRSTVGTGSFKLKDVVTKWNHIMSDSLLRSYGGNTFCLSGQHFFKGINGSVVVMRMLVVSIITPFIRGSIIATQHPGNIWVWYLVSTRLSLSVAAKSANTLLNSTSPNKKNRRRKTERLFFDFEGPFPTF